MYLTYAEYEEYGGTLDETIFSDLSFKVETIINYHTFNRFKNDTQYPTELKRLVYEGISTMNAKNNSILGDGSIKSQSNDGLSTSYNVVNAKDLVSLANKEFAHSIEMYLNGVKNQAGKLVLFRGLYADE